MYTEKMDLGGDDTSTVYCLDDGPNKPMATFVPFSPTSSTDWWSSLKSDVDSPKDNWSDSDSQQSIICGLESPNSIGNNGHSDALNKKSANSTTGSTTSSDDLSSANAVANGKGKKKKAKETPAVNKPAQVVARRNARERRRVQAVNWAFQRLRKVVPLEENKSKRMSKVKTLQLAIEYINQLQDLLQFTTQQSSDADLLADIFSDLQQQHVKIDTNDFSFRVPAAFYSQLIGENNEN